MLRSMYWPGLKMFTSSMPSNRLANEAEMNHKMAFPPTRPTVFRSPSLAMPTTSVVNTNGEMIICTRRKKMVLSILMLSAKLLAKTGVA